MAGEVDNTNSMSDKDRDMANRFSGAEKSPEVKDADDDETAEKKDKDSKKDEKGKKQVKIPRKLFGGEGSKESAAEEEPAKKPEKNLFAGLLKKEAKIDGSEPAHAEEAEQNPEQQLVEHTEEAPNETQGELTEDFQELVIDRLQEVEHELELPLVPEKAAEVVADAEFLEHVGERLEEGLSPEDAIDDALEDEFIPPEADATEQDLNDAENFEESDDDDPAATNQSQTQIPPPTPTPIPRRPVTPSPTTPAPPRPTPPSPPIPPIPPIPNPNLYTAPPTPNVVSAPNVVPMNEMYTRNRRTGDILLGGILGYMIGRRGGRKRTEARMQPEIDERDKALEDLGRKLDESEKKVRTITSERIIKEPELVNRVRDAEEPKAVIAEKLVENADTVSIEREKRIIEQQEKEFENILTEQTERSIERSNAEISDPIPVPMIERAPQPAPEARTQTEVIGEFREKRKDVKTMTVSELLEVGDNIFLEKTSLRQLYELGRIDAVNLRRVVISYMEGGQHYERIMRGSLEAVEMQRELRNEVKTDAPSGFGGGPGGSNVAVSVGQVAQTSLQNISQGSGAGDHNSAQAKTIFNEQQEDQMLVSNGTAIALGILAGIAIMVLVFLYSGSI